MRVKDSAGDLLVLVAEHTPNPQAVKLDVGRVIGPPGGADFPTAESALAGSPLAAALFDLEGVQRVFVGEDFVTVTKAEGSAWRELGDLLQRTVIDHIQAGRPVLSAGYIPTDVPPGGVGKGPPGSPDADRAGELELIRELLEEEIRPAVARDGGDVVLISYREGVVELELRGACADCPSSLQTLKLGIEARLRQEIPGLVSVIARG